MATIKKKAAKGDVTKLPARASKTAKAETPATTEVKASKYKGRTTGLRVMEFQDQTFAANTKAMLTDEELAAAWHDEFPEAVKFTAFHVKGARRDYNAGRHAKATPKPAEPLAEVLVVDGKRRFATDVKAEPKAKAEAAPVTTKPVARSRKPKAA